MSAKPVKKLYYSISEVSKMTGLRQYVLRYWETEFQELKPQKNRAGNRIYKEKDIEMIKRIMGLLYERKYTIEGARQMLKEKGKKSGKGQINLGFSTEEKNKAIEEIKEDIRSLVNLLSE